MMAIGFMGGLAWGRDLDTLSCSTIIRVYSGAILYLEDRLCTVTDFKFIPTKDLVISILKPPVSVRGRDSLT